MNDNSRRAWTRCQCPRSAFHFLKSVCVRLCSKGGKAQIIGPEEEDEEDDGYAFNEVRRTLAVSLIDPHWCDFQLSFFCRLYIFLLFLHCISLFPPATQLFLFFSLFLCLSRRWTVHSRTSSCWSHDRHTWRCSWDTSSPSFWTPTLWSVYIIFYVERM